MADKIVYLQNITLNIIQRCLTLKSTLPLLSIQHYQRIVSEKKDGGQNGSTPKHYTLYNPKTPDTRPNSVLFRSLSNNGCGFTQLLIDCTIRKLCPEKCWRTKFLNYKATTVIIIQQRQTLNSNLPLLSILYGTIK